MGLFSRGRAKDPLPLQSPQRYLFVCYANVCRSPLAEGVFRHLARQRKLDDLIEADSAGTSAIEAHPPHPLSIKIAQEHGIDLCKELRSSGRQLHREDLFRFDHILVMDRHNLADIERLARPSAFGPDIGQVASLRLLGSVGTSSWTKAQEIPDPIRGGPESYRNCYDLIERFSERLLDELEARL